MIGYITLGSNNVEAAALFYDQVFKEVGAKRVWDTSTFVAWGNTENASFFAISSPYNKEKATVGNGVMISIKAPNPETVDLTHAKAIELGASNEGSPGPREPNSYCAYFRDLDGNKINIYCIPD